MSRRNERFIEAVHASKDGFFDWNMEKNEVYYSPGYMAILGYSLDESSRANQGFKDLVHPEDIKKVIAIKDEFINYRDDYEVEFRMKNKDGEWIWILQRGKVFERDTHGKATRVIGTHIDLTDRKKAEVELRESQRRLLSHRELTPLGTIEYDADYIVQYWNPSAEKIFGYSKEEAIGRKIQDLIVTEKKRELFKSSGRSSFPARKNHIETNTTKNGASVTCEWYTTPIINNDGEAIGVTSVCLDITERLRAESEIKNLRNRLRDIFNSMPSVLIGLDEDKKITDWNTQAATYTGTPDTDAIGREFVDVLPYYKQFSDKIDLAISTGEPEYAQKIERFNDDSIHYEDITIYPLEADGKTGAVIRVDDVTDKVRMEKLMVQTEKMMSVGGLAAGMAHEINNPLGAILQGSQNVYRRLSKNLKSNRETAEKIGLDLNLLESYTSQRKIHTQLEGIQESAKKAADIVKNMLQFSRASESRMASVDLPLLVDNVLELANTNYNHRRTFDFKDVRVIKEYAEDIPQVMCTETEIEQVLLNLFSNAAWAMLTSEGVVKHQITIRLETEPDMVRIEVEDTGPGIKEDIQNRIFEPFFTTKPVGEGTGLGLSVAYMIITNNHKGKMEVQSEEGNGTTFIIHLPIQ